MTQHIIEQITEQADSLLRWYDRHRRVLPWRALPGQTPDPYAVWLSEIMLQQTTVQAVIGYYERFLARFPNITALAKAPQEDVLHLWAGLGYYARARNLHTCAKLVVERHHGHFPDMVEALCALPGIGPYTGRAVAAIAFNRPVVPVDGNVERVTARIFAVTTPLPSAKPELARLAETLNQAPVARERASDFAQALFDLGATICTVRNPSCLTCPLVPACQGRKQGIEASLPRRLPRKAKPVRYGVAFHLIDKAGNSLLRTRPESGLLGGMDELPGTEWREQEWQEEEALNYAPQLSPSIALNWENIGNIRHVFTHFTLYLKIYRAYLEEVHNCPESRADGVFRPARKAALPGLMKKAVFMGRQVGDVD